MTGEQRKCDGIVYEPQEVLNPSLKGTNCCKSLWVNYHFKRAYTSSTDQSHRQEEIIHKLAMKLKYIGDSIDHRMAEQVRLQFPQQESTR
ncbi:peroxisomal testis-specific protein 1 [Rhynchocyon petersi]